LALSAVAILAMGSTGFAGTAEAVNFKGKTIKVVIGYAAGGGYDRYGRQVARHIGRHLPGNPTVVAQNKPGAGSYKTVNYIYSQAPKDGTVFGTFARSVPILGFSKKSKQARIDPNKLTWIGTSSSYKNESYLMVVRKDTGIKTIADMQNLKKPLNFAATSFGSDGTDVPIILKDILRINVQPLRGYPGGNTLYLAVERGEAQARMVGVASMKTAMPHWLSDKSPVRVVLQFATKTRLPEFPNAPTAREVVTKQADKDLLDLLEAPFFMARPFAAPPGLPADITKVLRDGFMAAHSDPMYKAEAKKFRLLTSPVHGAEVQKLVASLGKKPRALYDRYTRLLKNPKSPVRTIKWKIVSGMISKIGKKGKFSFKIDGKGKAVKSRTRGRYTKVKLNGKKLSRKKIKAGMKCKMWYEGPGSYAGRLDCTM
jgi:tripartite-type tricarboxylate transporter receptor subunit TctC